MEFLQADFGLLLVVEEYPAFPHIGGDRHEAAFLLVEIEEVRLVWHAHQAAVVAVDPVVVIAGEARGAAALGQHGSVAKIVKLEHAWRRLAGRNDAGFRSEEQTSELQSLMRHTSAVFCL